MSLIVAPFQEWWPFLFLFLAGAIPTQIWRWIGAILSRSMDETSEILRWVKAVATALVAGLIAKLVVFPSGALADIPLFWRLMAMASGYSFFLLTRPRIIFGIIVAEIILVGSALFFS